VSTITYRPFGGKYSEEGSENHLYTGKEKDSSGLYYYGARYYDPDLGRFITRDQKYGKISQPQALNKYTYCINNPIKYIDPDGHDYWDPDWAKDWYVDEPGYSFESLMRGFALDLQKLIVSSMSSLGAEIRESRAKYGVIAGLLIFCVEIFLASIKINPYVGPLISLLACLLVVIYTEEAEFYNDLWENDPKYRELLKTAEYYQKLFEMDVDCEGELDIAMIDLNVYMLQAKYGEDWKAYAPAWLMRAYLWLMEKREKEQSNNNGNDSTSSGGSGSYVSPQGVILT
jgi:RHS repeat-associated protein